MSVPKLVVSCPMRFNSTAPSAASSLASARICSIGLDRIGPRMRWGMVQKLQPWLQPFADAQVGEVAGGEAKSGAVVFENRQAAWLPWFDPRQRRGLFSSSVDRS
jgi:hypothetical protein